MRALLALPIVLAALALAPTASASHGMTLVYHEDFEDPVGPEWSHPVRWTTSNGRTLGGTYDTVTPEINVRIHNAVALPAHDQVTLRVELYALGAYYGSQGGWAPMGFYIVASNPWYEPLHSTTFSTIPGHPQSYPDMTPTQHPAGTGADEFGVNYGHPTRYASSTGKWTVERSWAHSDSDLSITIRGVGALWRQEQADWAIDNFQLFVHNLDSGGGASAPIPELATLALVGAGAVGVGAVALRRRR